MSDIQVFQDDNASYCFIVGTSDEKEAEAALREQENVWFGEDESEWRDFEKRMDFADFGRMTFYIRGERIAFNREELPGRGRVAIREGFLAPLD